MDREILLAKQAGRLLQDNFHLQAEADLPEGRTRREGKHKLSSGVPPGETLLLKEFSSQEYLGGRSLLGNPIISLCWWALQHRFLVN